MLLLHKYMDTNLDLIPKYRKEYKYNYENEKNIVKRFINSFHYKKIMKSNALEDLYVKNRNFGRGGSTS